MCITFRSRYSFVARLAKDAGRASGISPKSTIVEVADDGEGIAAEHLPYVFDRFYRVDMSRNREMGSSGLGLVISQAFVRGHGRKGTTDREGVGTRTAVCFELPMTRQCTF
jgi:signal transduction histidine kinase